MRITREIGIDMGHRVPSHASKCKNLHGHRYRVIATVQGNLHNYGEQEGMVADFGFIKTTLMHHVDRLFDHGTALWVKDPILAHELGSQYSALAAKARLHGYAAPANGWKWGKLVITNDVPTAENLAKLWFNLIKTDCENYLHDLDGRLYSMTVWETPNCSAVYRPNVTGPFLSAKNAVMDSDNEVTSRGMSDHA